MLEKRGCYNLYLIKKFAKMQLTMLIAVVLYCSFTAVPGKNSMFYHPPCGYFLSLDFQKNLTVRKYNNMVQWLGKD
jgi:hypothetical protein